MSEFGPCKMEPQPEPDYKALYLISEQERIKSEQERIKREQELIKSEHKVKKLKKENAIAEEALAKYRALEFISQSKTQVYHNFLSKAKLIETVELPVLDTNLLKNLWKSILDSGAESLLQEGAIEKDQVHPFIENVLEAVIRKFKFKLRKHKELILRTPDLRPDFSLSPTGSDTPGWLECYGFIECKAFKTGREMIIEGGGQAISYLANAMSPKIDTSLSSNKIFKFAAFTDGRRIQFFFCKRYKFIDKNFVYSPTLDLFPRDLNPEVVPQGLIYLCQLMKLMSDSKFPDNLIKIGQEFATIEKIHQRTDDIIVADVLFDSDSNLCLIKQAVNNNKSGTFSLRKEVMMYKLFQGTPFKTLKLSQKCLPDCLVLEEIGITLKSWATDILFKDNVTDEKIKKRRFVDCIVKVFDQIHLLHKQKFTHGDIRPANIIVLKIENEDEPHLIDFVTATKFRETLQFIHGTVIYMSDDVLNAPTPFILNPIHDLEAFAFSILDCIDNHFFETFLLQAAREFTGDNEYILSGYCEKRKIALEQLKNNVTGNPQFKSDHFIYPELVLMFFSFLNQLRSLSQTSDSISGKDYKSLRKTLSLKNKTNLPV